MVRNPDLIKEHIKKTGLENLNQEEKLAILPALSATEIRKTITELANSDVQKELDKLEPQLKTAKRSLEWIRQDLKIEEEEDPEVYLDMVTAEMMTDPYVSANGQYRMDRTTYDRLLKMNFQDPFTNNDLDKMGYKEDKKLQNEIKAYRKGKEPKRVKIEVEEEPKPEVQRKRAPEEGEEPPRVRPGAQEPEEGQEE